MYAIRIQILVKPKLLCVVVCTCAVRNCLECRYRQHSGNISPSVQPPVGDQMSPIQALIAGVQAPARPNEPVIEHGSVLVGLV